MCGTFRPLHLLFLTEAHTDDLIDGRFHKAGADAFPVTVALAIVRNETLIILDIGLELLNGFEQFSSRIQFHLDRLHDLQRLVDVAVPQKPFEAFEFPHHRVTQRVVLLLIPNLVRQAFDRLLEHRQTHGYMEPISQMLGLRAHIQLEVPHGVASVREKGELLIQL